MSQILPRYNARAERIESERKVARAVLEGQGAEVPKTVTRATLPGDMRRLRGIPVACRGVGGVSPNTHPESAIR